MNISKKLDVWHKAKLITAAQKKDILSFEDKAKKPTFLYALFFLSAFCIGLGIISLITSNWKEIPDFVKLAADLLLLLGAICGVFYAKDHKKDFLAEALLFLYAVLILGTIGLVAQIYHLPSQGLLALLFWSALVTPLVFLSKKTLLPFLWLPVFFVSGCDTLFDHEWFRHFLDHIVNYLGITAGVIFAMILISIYILGDKYSLKKIPHIVAAFKYWLIIYIGYAVVMFDIFSSVNYSYHSYHEEYNAPTSALLVMLALVGGFYAAVRKTKYVFWSYFLGMSAFFAYSFTQVSQSGVATEILGALFTLATLFFVAIYAYKKGNTKIINAASILIAIRFFIIYLQVFSSLATTGIGLIISGLVFLGIGFAWQRTRKTLLSHIKEKK